jgi:hypothetical protein
LPFPPAFSHWVFGGFFTSRRHTAASRIIGLLRLVSGQVIQKVHSSRTFTIEPITFSSSLLNNQYLLEDTAIEFNPQYKLQAAQPNTKM